MSAPTVRAVRRTLNQHLENAWDRHPTLLKIGVCNCGNDVYTRKALLHEELSLVCFDSDDEKGEDGHLWSEVQNGLDRPFTGLKNRAKTTRADLHGALKTFRKRKQVTADDDDDSAVSVGGAAAFQNIGIQRPSASGQQPSQFEGPAPGTKRKRSTASDDTYPRKRQATGSVRPFPINDVSSSDTRGAELDSNPGDARNEGRGAGELARASTAVRTEAGRPEEERPGNTRPAAFRRPFLQRMSVSLARAARRAREKAQEQAAELSAYTIYRLMLGLTAALALRDGNSSLREAFRQCDVVRVYVLLRPVLYGLGLPPPLMAALDDGIVTQRLLEMLTHRTLYRDAEGPGGR